MRPSLAAAALAVAAQLCAVAGAWRGDDPTRDYVPCFSPALPPSPTNDTTFLVNPGGNVVVLYACK
jgi:hypothetical protein